MNEPRKPMNEEQLDRLVRDLAAGYHEPPHELDEDARQRLFARIQESRRSRSRRRTPAPRPVLRVGLQAAALAAVLVVGIAIGRWSPPSSPPERTPVATASDPATRNVYRFAARAYLERTENLLLTLERAAYAPEPSTPWRTATAEPTVDWAHDLLLETRLLQDSPAVHDDAQLEKLLDDLELLLARIVQAASGDEEPDESPLKDAAVLQRVRGELERSSVLNEI